VANTIQLPEDAFDAHLTACATQGADSFVASVRPIYGGRVRDQRPEHVGSCILLDVDGRRILATAAHIADQSAQRGALFVGGPPGTSPVPLRAQMLATTAPGGNRNVDHYDVAFCELPESALPEMGKVNFVSADRLSHNRAITSGRRYTAIGYPISRNKDSINHAAHTIVNRRSIYTAGVEDMPQLASALGVTGEDHLFLRFGKHFFDMEGQPMNSFGPKGLSGGALLDIGDFRSAAILTRAPGASAMLSGMLIEHNKRHRAMVAVKIGPVVAAIRNALR
jgi:hypothetical protein